MNKKQKAFSLSVIISSFLIISLCTWTGCQSSKAEVVDSAVNKLGASYNGEPAPEPENVPVKIEEATEVKVEKKNISYFSSIDKAVLEEIESGSPMNLRHAVQKLHKATIDYSESEKVIYNIADSIMTVVWPSERALDNVPPVGKNHYLEIIDSAKKGIFEEIPEAKDFFELVLPALCLTVPTVRTDFYSNVEEALKKALSKRSNSILCNYLLGLLYEKQADYEKAVSYFDKATESNAIVYEILYEKASCLIKLGKYEQVSKVLDKLVVQFPSDVRILKLYANTALLLKDYSKAEQYASLVLQQNPSDLEFVLFRAKIFVETSEYLKASSLLDVYARSYPDNREYLLLRAKIQKEWNKNITAAVSTIEKAITIYPNDTDIVLYAAELASESNHKINGKTGGELAAVILENDSMNQRALQITAQSLLNEDKYAEAYSYSKKLMGLSNIPLNASYLHVKICLALRYNDEAWKYASSLYDRYTDDQDAIQNYIEVMVATGRTASASKLINSLLAGTPSSSMKSFLFYERSFLAANETAQLSDLRSSLIANPRNSDALFRMYKIYFNRKDYRKAQYYLKQVVSLNPNDEKYLRLNSELDTLVK